MKRTVHDLEVMGSQTGQVEIEVKLDEIEMCGTSA